jgi:5-methylcytosine-specific restriction protein B
MTQPISLPPDGSPVWFVSAHIGNDYQLPRFLEEGIWEQSGTFERDQEFVKSMRPGERIAVKSFYVRKQGLPFDTGGKAVTMMAIKAIGTILENMNDGRRVRVQWHPVEPEREWYFYTYRRTIWRVTPGQWMPDALIAFAFDGAEQDYGRFVDFWYPERVQRPDRELLSTDDYTIDDLLRDGAFLTRSELEQMLATWRSRKNLILQGPPGTGKTWLARRLAHALIGERDDESIRVVQFHPNLSYEDFVRGWRPSGEGKLSLVDGLFLEAIEAASRNPEVPFVVVIEEINRGNPAQIFGELLTLLEAGKRSPTEAIELCYPDPDGVRRPIFVPPNLHVIGTMNIADRSLAMMDLALRRRFAFVDLEPRLGRVWREWVVKHRGLEPEWAREIERRLEACNERIASDARLGKAFRIGHSYVTPPESIEPGESRTWFRRVIETEIGPLLDEYWFDTPEEARKARELLLKDEM